MNHARYQQLELPNPHFYLVAWLMHGSDQTFGAYVFRPWNRRNSPELVVQEFFVESRVGWDWVFQLGACWRLSSAEIQKEWMILEEHGRKKRLECYLANGGQLHGEEPSASCLLQYHTRPTYSGSLKEANDLLRRPRLRIPKRPNHEVLRPELRRDTMRIEGVYPQHQLGQ